MAANGKVDNTLPWIVITCAAMAAEQSERSDQYPAVEVGIIGMEASFLMPGIMGSEGRRTWVDADNCCAAVCTGVLSCDPND